MEQPEYREVRSWDHQDVSIRQKAVGLTMDQEGKVWFWCQTMMETPDRVPLFAFVEKIPNPTLNSWSGDFDPLGDRLFERGAERVRQITAGALQLQPWSGGWITNEFVTPLSMIWEPLDGAEPPEVVEQMTRIHQMRHRMSQPIPSGDSASNFHIGTMSRDR